MLSTTSTSTTPTKIDTLLQLLIYTPLASLHTIQLIPHVLYAT